MAFLNDDEVYELVSTIAAEDGIEIHSIDTGRTPQAGMDLGSRNFEAMTKPKVLLLVGEGISA
ncbi:MAG: hypothetical protein Ct9H300mP22_1740 [Gammaproteobacteria bacterium]|nr:MAG: hypothetical protein Ct9H300mP22_1740 [Gammaproteobacteria bacterium]